MKTLFTLCLAFISFYTFSQTTTTAKKDTLTEVDSPKYIGTLISTTINGDNTGEVEFKTEDGQVHHLSSSSIAHLKRANDVQDYKLPPADKKAQASSALEAQDEPGINWSDSNIPHEALKKHRVGLGLTISGTGLIVGGIVLAAGAANTSTTSYSNGITSQTTVKVNGLGVLFILAGLPMMIVGAIKLNKAKKIAHNSLIRMK